MKTVNGIYYDINDSDYTYDYKNLKFYFTSEVYKRKFIERLSDEIKNETLKFKEKFKLIDIDLENLIIIKFYQKIEKRGFKIIKYEDENSLIFYDKPPKFELLML